MNALLYEPLIVFAVTILGLSLVYRGKKTSGALWAIIIALLALGITTKEVAFSGFSKDTFYIIAFLMLFSRGLENTGVISLVLNRVLLGRKTVSTTIFTIMGVSIGFSAFLNNTLIVSLFMRPLNSWCSRNGITPSKVMIPLSYAAIVGGLCTLVGTSTNLVALGILKSFYPNSSIGFWEIGKFGIILSLGVILVFPLLHRFLLPERNSLSKAISRSREYSVEYLVTKDSELIGRSIGEVGFRNMQGLFLAEVYRGDQKIIGPNPNLKIEAADQIVFVGAPESLAEIRIYKGLVPAQTLKFASDKNLKNTFFEAVLSNRSHLVGKTLKSASFRDKYNAVVLAIYRDGELIKGKTGNLKLLAGDSLLLESDRDLVDAWKQRHDFFFVSKVFSDELPSFEKTTRATLVGLLVLGLMMASSIPVLYIALTGAVLMILLKCVFYTDGLNSLDKETLLTIAAGLSLGQIWQMSWSKSMPYFIDHLPHLTPLVFLALAYLLNVFVTELVANNAAIAICLGLTLPLCGHVGVDPKILTLVLMVASSASFMTIYGYQTNLMVYGVGGYRQRDFVRAGGAMHVVFFICMIVALRLFYPEILL